MDNAAGAGPDEELRREHRSAPTGRPLRIVHCFRSPVGGIFRHVRDLSLAQIAAGHEVGIICDSTTGGVFEDGLIAELAPRLQLGIVRTPMQRHVGPGDLAALRRTFSLIKKLQPDVLHGHGAKGGVHSRIVGSLLRAFRYRVARLYSPHGGSLHYDETSRTGRLFFLAERIMARLTDHLLFVADYERRTFERKVSRIGAPWSIVLNGLAPEEFERVTPAADAADFLFMGMMRDLKGPDLVIDALSRAGTVGGRGLSAVMIGAGDDRPAYERKVAALGMADRIRFLDPVPARYGFTLGRVMVVPSRAEAMPYIVLEALAAGKPLIATNVGGIPEIFADKAGVLVEPDAGQILERMLEAVEEPERFAERMPSASELTERFSAATMAGAVEAAYRSALEKA